MWNHLLSGKFQYQILFTLRNKPNTMCIDEWFVYCLFLYMRAFCVYYSQCCTGSCMHEIGCSHGSNVVIWCFILGVQCLDLWRAQFCEGLKLIYSWSSLLFLVRNGCDKCTARRLDFLGGGITAAGKLISTIYKFCEQYSSILNIFFHSSPFKCKVHSEIGKILN